MDMITEFTIFWLALSGWKVEARGLRPGEDPDFPIGEAYSGPYDIMPRPEGRQDLFNIPLNENWTMPSDLSIKSPGTIEVILITKATSFPVASSLVSRHEKNIEFSFKFSHVTCVCVNLSSQMNGQLIGARVKTTQRHIDGSSGPGCVEIFSKPNCKGVRYKGSNFDNQAPSFITVYGARSKQWIVMPHFVARSLKSCSC